MRCKFLNGLNGDVFSILWAFFRAASRAMFVNMKIFHCTVVAMCCIVSNVTAIFNNAIDQPFTNSLRYPFSPLGFSSPLTFRQGPNAVSSTFSSLGALSSGSLKRRCPICDPSVYEYCSEKLFHDSCCCNDPNNPYEQLPYQCQWADCSFLHANSCREHKLITSCCCTNYFLKK